MPALRAAAPGGPRPPFPAARVPRFPRPAPLPAVPAAAPRFRPRPGALRLPQPRSRRSPPAQATPLG
ncbi:hypothetical protein APASM_5782 [Actinosynnema pretiosum subsp. pretiosum]|nr:hypothetical protein APASM_5782 [Actinosynnema pretiosum subsp. pretiosum]